MVTEYKIFIFILYTSIPFQCLNLYLFISIWMTGMSVNNEDHKYCRMYNIQKNDHNYVASIPCYCPVMKNWLTFNAILYEQTLIHLA